MSEVHFSSTTWDIELRSGPAQTLFDETAERLRSFASGPMSVGHSVSGRCIRILTVDSPAVVLGSSQKDPGGLAVPTVRRRSGGGAVWLSNALLWFDIFIPKDDPLWRDDISRSMWWVGQFVANALTKEGLTGLHVHRGAMLRVPGSGTVCWLGTGPGEVVVRNAHTVAKVVGIAQRRTRYAALFQVGVALRPSQFQLGGLFDIDPNVIEASEPPIGLAAPGVSRALDRDRLVASAIASLPDWSM